MTLVAVGTMPVAQILIRRYIMVSLSATEAGWWEAMNRISNIYLLVVSTSFGVYYLPRLSEIVDIQELRKEIYKAFQIIIPLLLGGFSLIYLFGISLSESCLHRILFQWQSYSVGKWLPICLK